MTSHYKKKITRKRRSISFVAKYHGQYVVFLDSKEIGCAVASVSSSGFGMLEIYYGDGQKKVHWSNGLYKCNIRIATDAEVVMARLKEELPPLETAPPKDEELRNKLEFFSSRFQ